MMEVITYSTFSRRKLTNSSTSISCFSEFINFNRTIKSFNHETFITGTMLSNFTMELRFERTKQRGSLHYYQRDLNYPGAIDYDLYCGDPKHAGKVLEAGLEDQGLVTVQRTVKLKDVGKDPIIRFTEKAQPYLLPTPEEDRVHKIQKVKIAEEVIIEVTGIRTLEDGKAAIAEYQVGYKDISGFSALIPNRDYTQQATKQAYIALYDDGWRLEKRK